MAYQTKVLKTVRSPKGYLIAPVHYRHDPDKDDAWETSERAKYDSLAAWNREQHFDTREVRGAPAYPQFNFKVHIKDTLELTPDLPLCLSMDFNVAPMIWNISQIHNGVLYVLDEVVMDPANIPAMTTQFRNAYSNWVNDIYVYGDATGTHRTPQTSQTDYDAFLLGMRTHAANVVMKVPAANPPVKDRLNAVNAKLRTTEGGRVEVHIHPRCKYLIGDFAEVVLEKGGANVHKTWKPDDPYHNRTHASDGIGYLIAREWPIIKEVLAKKRFRRQKTPARRYQRIIGAV